jgi:lysozyme
MKANRGDWEGAADAFMQWTKGGGRELPGLVKRRKDERALFLSDSSPVGLQH